MSDLFYILSLHHRYEKSTYLVFWRPDSCGYANPLPWAGKYTREQITAKADYLNDGKTTLAVPVDAVDRLGIAPAPGMIDGNVGPVVDNSPENLKALRRAAEEARAA